MSTDRPAPRKASRLRRGFRARVVAVVSVLLVAGVVLTALGSLQGPRFRSSQFNGEAAIQRTGERLVLQTDQALGSVSGSDIQVDPQTPVTASASGTAVTVQFGQPLRASTHYRISAHVHGAATGREATIDDEFTTPSQQVFSLVRDTTPGADDFIERYDLGTGQGTVVFRAPQILEYAALSDALAIVTLADDGTPSLILQRFDQTAPETFDLPNAGDVTDLKASPAAGLIGFVSGMATAEGDKPGGDGADSVLYILDPSDDTGVAKPVLGADGTPISVIDWSWVPGTSSLVVQANDESCWLVNPLGTAAPSPLGAHAELRGWVPGTTTLVVADPDSGSALDLASGTTIPLHLPDDQLSADDYSETTLMLNGSDDYLELIAKPDPDPDSSWLDFSVIRVNPGGVTTVYTPPAPDDPIRSVCLSPNAQYLAVEVGSTDGDFDNYPVLPSFSQTSTYFIDLTNPNAPGRGVQGFLANWCS